MQSSVAVLPYQSYFTSPSLNSKFQQQYNVTSSSAAKLADANPHMTPMTMCPGTLAYMPPEALYDLPVYNNKLDCFSFGVLDIQILTRQFLEPSQKFKTIEISAPRVPDGTVKVPVPEAEHCQSST